MLSVRLIVACVARSGIKKFDVVYHREDIPAACQRARKACQAAAQIPVRLAEVATYSARNPMASPVSICAMAVSTARQ